ncbi:MAG: D-tyrosyl-tRNA(Tyr) deacylase [Thermoanaerobaculaceae bacterium]|nr:D-tyrosyl-tRNA(Tyr) deacylase [Thermoanaerobaculaceae bacterium]MDI9623045.1 D-aminoacyl-tRNA deacylase [Acidobacteriota bacterium]NLH10470.1 D-tyrosyl-tRNA(Tyr) deacylase [Holophagae bacterium]HPW56783.1 D-aminoacyl-tRNA deacylase [Thermoanaerobaculaceae bacterium]
MRIVVQRVSRAVVRVDGQPVGEIGRGLLLFVGIERGDGPVHVERAAHRLATLRVFADAQGHMNLSLDEVEGAILVVSQFTLAGSIRHGRRPDFTSAARPEDAAPLVESLIAALRARGRTVRSGVFRAHMEVEVVNDGPVTFVWDDPPPAS